MVLARWQGTVVDDLGNIQDGATVTVRTETTGTPLASLFSDRDGVVGIANPTTTDADGFVGFHVAGGAYQITATKGAFSRTWRYVPIGTAGEGDMSAFGRELVNVDSFVEAQAVVGVREVLTANRTYYVRTDGSDSNTGLVDSAGGAFLTLQHAYNVIAHLIDCAGFSPIIQMGDGTYTAGIDATQLIVGAATLYVRGNLSTPGNVILSVTNAHGILNRVAGLTIDVGGLEFRTTTAGNCLWAWKGSGIVLGATCNFGASAGDHFLASEGGLIEITQNYNITGSAVNHWHAFGDGEIICQNKTITLTGTPAFSGSFVGNATATMYVTGNTFSGAATGSRYLIHKNGYVDTGSGTPETYFPGSVAGTQVGGGVLDNVEGTLLSKSSILSNSATGGVGYSTGAGDAVTQSTNKTTTVATNNKMCGQITMNNATLNAGASVVFQVNNSNVDANDVVLPTVSNGVTANSYTVSVVHTGAGSFNLRVTNVSGSNLSDAVVLNFVIIKSVTS